MRRIHTCGSLRDMIYGTDYSKSYLAKYGNPKIRKPLTMGQIAHYGMQLLKALRFLHDKGLPHGKDTFIFCDIIFPFCNGTVPT